MREGFIYLATNPLFPGYVKIGRTTHVRNRMKKLATGVPEAYKVVHVEFVDDAVDTETELHQIFDVYHSREKNGEWFKYSKKAHGSIDGFVEKIKKHIHGSLNQKIDKIFRKYGVDDGYNRDFFIERLNLLDARNIEAVIIEEAEALLDYHPSIDEIY